MVKKWLIACVKGYRYLLSPWLGNSCRFEPTCSVYSIQALEKHGAFKGSALTAWRILRCHPGCAGGYDPVPENSSKTNQGLFTRLIDSERISELKSGAGQAQNTERNL